MSAMLPITIIFLFASSCIQSSFGGSHQNEQFQIINGPTIPVPDTKTMTKTEVIMDKDGEVCFEILFVSEFVPS